MLSFLRRLLGLTPTPNTSAGSVRAVRRHTDSGSQGRATTDRYFSTMNAMQEAISDRNYARAAVLTKENVEQIPALVRSTMREYTSFPIRSIPGLEGGCTTDQAVNRGFRSSRQHLRSCSNWSRLVYGLVEPRSLRHHGCPGDPRCC